MVISFLDVKRADRNYEYFFGDLYGLMLNAGKRVCEIIEKQFGQGNRILVVCGSGNNGGDGLVAASLLSGNNEVSVCVIGGMESMKTSESRRASRRYTGPVLPLEDLRKEIDGADIIVDAIFGSGISGSPRKPYDDVIRALNNSGRKIVSVDIPSGMNSGLAVDPDITVTFTDIKEGMTESNSGTIYVQDIGIPEKVFNYNGPGDFVHYSLPGAESHKGMNGTVALVSGWTFYGSAVISSRGAVKSGADLVRIYATPENAAILSSYSPDIIVRNTGKAGTLDELPKHDTVIIGPGLGKDQDLTEVIMALHGFTGTLILDAEGLFAMDKIRASCPGAYFILTPHRGEFGKISGNEANLENVLSYARRNSCTVVLKGAQDIITDGRRIRYTEGGNARMTMGGTGDLLAGVTGAISTRVRDGFYAACIGSFVNKKAGDMAFKQKSFWYDIHDMIEMVPEAMKLSIGIAHE